MNKVPMTIKGAERLREELQDLKSNARPNVISAIAEARAHGDLKENAEYHAAKERQSFIEGRIQELEGKLSNCQIIDVTSLPLEDKVIFGATVKLIHGDNKQSVQYQIVGEDEADVKTGKLSVNAPLARALIGKFVGDEVVVQAPGGSITYEIDHVSYV